MELEANPEPRDPESPIYDPDPDPDGFIAEFLAEVATGDYSGFVFGAIKYALLFFYP